MSWLRDLPAPAPLSKSEFRSRSYELREELVRAQVELRETPTAALLLLAGVDGAGKGETVQLFNEWMDPRWIRTHSFDKQTTEEVERPSYWRYWRRLPARGEMGMFLSAWYSQALLGRVNGASDAWLSAELDRIRRLEDTLTLDGMRICKLWLHLDADAQARRFREYETDPRQSWRVTPQDWANWSRYGDFVAAAEEILEATHSETSAWHVVEGSDERHRALQSGGALLASMRAADPEVEVGPPPASVLESCACRVGVGSSPEALTKAHYREELAALQGSLNRLHRRAREAGVSLIGVFEGRDASGKGGSIRRVVAALDARSVEVVRTGPPSEEELQHPYLWRFWRRLPRAGHVTLFDRSWYGRVLIERVEKLARKREWSRAYDEINDFERQIVEHGAVLVKFWLEIDRSEQQRRFKERQRLPHKRWKLTEDDLRNRNLWEEYDVPIAEMLERTSTDAVPWRLVSANDKYHARIEVLRGFVSALEERLEVLAPGPRLAVRGR